MGRKKKTEGPKVNEGRAKIPVSLRLVPEDYARLKALFDALPAHGRSMQSMLEGAALKLLADLEREYQQHYGKTLGG